MNKSMVKQCNHSHLKTNAVLKSLSLANTGRHRSQHEVAVSLSTWSLLLPIMWHCDDLIELIDLVVDTFMHSLLLDVVDGEPPDYSFLLLS